MIFYESTDDQGRVHLTGTQADAREVNKDFKQIDIPTDKANLMAFVQKLYDQVWELSNNPMDAPAICSEPDPDPEREQISEPVQEQTPAVSYAQYSIEIDEVFENLPLSHQLHLASLAMENARMVLKTPSQTKATS